MPRIGLTIAGHDPSSGAGISADLQVLASHGHFGVSAITALTVQSTQGVAAIHPVDAALLRHTLQYLLEDLPVEGVKMGMLASRENVLATAGFLESAPAQLLQNSVLDPVLCASSGAPLLEPQGITALRERLLPLVRWITPNRTELAVLTGLPADSDRSARTAADALGTLYPSLYVVVTGGDQDPPTDLLRLPDGTFHTLSGERINTTSTHGTGCAFSSALLSGLMSGLEPLAAAQGAKAFVTQALRNAPGLGKGRGPLQLQSHISLLPR